MFLTLRPEPAMGGDCGHAVHEAVGFELAQAPDVRTVDEKSRGSCPPACMAAVGRLTTAPRAQLRNG